MTVDKPPSRGLRYGLIISLAVNVAFIGCAIAMVLHHHLGPPPPPAGGKAERFISRLAETLPAPDAEKMRSALESKQPDLKRDETEMRAARERADELLRADPFDAAAFAAAIEDFRTARRKYETVLQESFQTGVATISPEARRKLADMHGF